MTENQLPPLYDKEGLEQKILAFIAEQDGEYKDEWYATQWDFAATILSDFAKYMGLELIVPEYIPQLKKPEIDRNALLKAMMPGLLDLFDIEYKKISQ